MELRLAYERLDVYRCAIEFLALSSRVIAGIPGGHRELIDQLKRAALSIPLNIAEGVGKNRVTDRKRYWAIARGSAMECGAIFDAASALGLLEQDIYGQGKELLVRIVSMLTKMAC